MNEADQARQYEAAAEMEALGIDATILDVIEIDWTSGNTDHAVSTLSKASMECLTPLTSNAARGLLTRLYGRMASNKPRKAKGTVVETRIWEAFSFHNGTGGDQFAQLKADFKGRRYSIRTYKRTVSADGVNIPVIVAIVRDNDKPEGS